VRDFSQPVSSTRIGTRSRRARLRRRIWADRYLYLMIAPVIAYYLIFHYAPMYGTIIAFKDFSPGKGITGSPWVGFENFRDFFGSFYFTRILRNTILLSLNTLVWGFPIPIIFAMLLNELRNRYVKRTVQTVSYLPHFISVVVVTGMMTSFLAPNGGVINKLLGVVGVGQIDFLSQPGYFRSLYVSSEIWQGFGWGAIIYLAALAGIDPSLYEAAEVDGASRWQKAIFITLPGLLPVTVILLILNMGNVMSVGFEKILLLYNPATYETSDVIQTYIYRRGIVSSDFSLAAAIGLFNSTINLILLLSVNWIARKWSETSLW
jgi:putative aldouronate transport system permease protein